MFISCSLTLSVPPTFSSQPTDVMGVLGSRLTATLTCSAEGDPTPTISWLRPDLTPLPIDPDTNAPQFEELTREDEGTYTCLAVNSAGEIRTQFVLTVEGKSLQNQIELCQTDISIMLKI